VPVAEPSSAPCITKDAIVLNTAGDGELTEIDTIVGGTGEHAGATGYFIASGTFSQGTGLGTYVGKILRSGSILADTHFGITIRVPTLFRGRCCALELSEN
jgi:hypothetical protein